MRGLLLAFGGGAYIHIGAIECMAVVYNLKLRPRQSFVAMLAFLVATVAIGLVLLDHKHCQVTIAIANATNTSCTEQGDDPHAGHGHRL